MATKGGVRISHPTARNARFTIVEPKPYPVPYTCTAPEFGGCGGVHQFKTHHLNIDETGACIVAADLFQKIRHLLVAEGFAEGNVVKKPPTMVLGMAPRRDGTGSWGGIEIIHGKGVTGG